MGVFQPCIQRKTGSQLRFPDHLSEAALIPHPLFSIRIVENHHSRQSTFGIVIGHLGRKFVFIPTMEEIHLSLPRQNIRIIALVVLLVSSVLNRERIDSICPHHIGVESKSCLTAEPQTILKGRREQAPGTCLGIHFQLPGLRRSPVYPAAFDAQDSSRSIMPSRLHQVATLPDCYRELANIGKRISRHVNLSCLHIAHHDSIVAHRRMAGAQTSHTHRLQSTDSTIVTHLHSSHSFGSISH